MKHKQLLAIAVFLSFSILVGCNGNSSSNIAEERAKEAAEEAAQESLDELSEQEEQLAQCDEIADDELRNECRTNVFLR